MWQAGAAGDYARHPESCDQRQHAGADSVAIVNICLIGFVSEKRWMYFCIFVFLYFCVFAFSYCCICCIRLYVSVFVCTFVFLYFRIFVFSYFCIFACLYFCICITRLSGVALQNFLLRQSSHQGDTESETEEEGTPAFEWQAKARARARAALPTPDRLVEAVQVSYIFAECL